jgi:hypothetical protein
MRLGAAPQPDGSARSQVRHRIDRVGGDQQDRIGSVLQDIGDDLVHHSGIAREQLQARLARFLVGSGSDDDHAAARQVRVITSPDIDGVGKGHRMQDIISFCLGPFFV